MAGTSPTPSLSVAMVTADCADPAALAGFWAGALRTTVVFEVEGFVMLAPPTDGAPALGFQKVPEERAGKNRLHLDLGAPEGGRAAEVERLVGLGATELGERGGPEYGGMTWVTLSDPEGNEFCVGEH